MTATLPAELKFGFVADRVVRAVGDTTDDPDRYPNGVPATGTVEFTPLSNVRYTRDRPASRVSVATIVCKIHPGDDPADPDHNPERAGLLVDPAGHVGNVALVVGDYRVETHLDDGTFDAFDIRVEEHHTEDDPAWLADYAEITPSTYERFVVNEAVYSDTVEAREEAQQYVATVKGYRDTAVQAAVTATTAATTATTGATTATQAATTATTAANTATTAAAATPTITVGPTPPANPRPGDLWLDTTEGGAL